MKSKKIISVILTLSVIASAFGGYESLGGVSFAAPIRADVGTEFTDTVKSGGFDGSGNTDVIFTYKFTSVDSGTAEVSLIGAEAKNGGNLTGFSVPATVSESSAKDYSDSRGKAFSKGTVKVTGIDIDGKNFGNTNQIRSISMDEVAGNLTTVSIQNFDYSESSGAKLSLGLNNAANKFTKLEEVDFSGSHVRFDSSSGDDNIAIMLSGCEKTLKKLDMSALADGSDRYNSQDGVNTAFDLKKFTALTYVDLSGNVGIETISLAPDVYGNKSYTTLNITGDTNLDTLSVIADGKDIKKYRENNPAIYQGVRFITNGGNEGSSVLDLSGYEMRNVDVEYASLTGFKAPSAKNGVNLNIDVSHNYIRTLELSKAAGSLTSLGVSENQLLDIDLKGQSALSSLKADDNFLTSIDISECRSLASMSLVGNYIPETNLIKDTTQSARALSKQKDITTFFTVSGDAGMISTEDDEKAFIQKSGSARLYIMAAVLGAPEGFAKRLAGTVKWEERTAGDSAVSLGSASVTSATDTYVPGLNGYASIAVVSTAMTGNAAAKAGETVTAYFGGDKDSISIASDSVAILDRDMTSGIGDNSALMSNEVRISSVFDYTKLAAKSSSKGAKITITSDNPAGKAGDYKAGMGRTLYTALASSLSENAAAMACKVGTANIGYGFKQYNYNDTKVTKDVTVTGSGKLVAVYNENKYSIAFSSNGGSGTMDRLADNMYSQKVKVPAATFTNKNGSFTGWVLDKNLTKEGSFARLYKSGTTEYQVVTPGRTSATMYAIWNSSEYTMKLNKKTATLTLGDPGSVINPAELELDVVDEAGLSCGQYDGNTRSKVSKAPKYAYMSSDDKVVSCNENGIFYATGAGKATVYIMDVANSKHAIGSIEVTVGGKSSASAKTTIKEEEEDDEEETTDTAKKGTITVGSVKYKYSGSDLILMEAGDVEKLTVDTVMVDGKTLKVVSIAKSAFKDNKDLKKVVIGANVKKIGQTAFLRCKNLKSVVIKSENLIKGGTVGKNALKSISPKATIKINSRVYDKTKKVLDKKAGIAATVTFKKIS